jgi:hypothetical protein
MGGAFFGLSFSHQSLCKAGFKACNNGAILYKVAISER